MRVLSIRLQGDWSTAYPLSALKQKNWSLIRILIIRILIVVRWPTECGNLGRAWKGGDARQHLENGRLNLCVRLSLALALIVVERHLRASQAKAPAPQRILNHFRALMGVGIQPAMDFSTS